MRETKLKASKYVWNGKTIGVKFEFADDGELVQIEDELLSGIDEALGAYNVRNGMLNIGPWTLLRVGHSNSPAFSITAFKRQELKPSSWAAVIMDNKSTRTVTLSAGEDGYIVIESSGITDQGKTAPEAFANIKEAIELQEEVN